MRYPMDPITATEPTLEERIRLEGAGRFGVDALAGVGFQFGSDLRLLALAEGGWRQVQADLVHEQYVVGEDGSTKEPAPNGRVPMGRASFRRSDARRVWSGCLAGRRLTRLVDGTVSSR